MKNYKPPLTPKDHEAIVKLFHEGHGAQTICLKLRLPSGHITRYLDSIGLKRTLAQSKLAKPFCFKRGPE